MSESGYVLREYDGPNNTPAVPLIYAALAELREKGFATNALSGNWDHQCVVAFKQPRHGGLEQLPVGLMTWEHTKWTKVVWVHLGWVDPVFRRQGVYRMMWDRVVFLARKAGAVEVQGGHHVDNWAMRQVAEKLGRRETFVTTSYMVPHVEELKPGEAAIQDSIPTSNKGDDANDANRTEHFPV